MASIIPPARRYDVEAATSHSKLKASLHLFFKRSILVTAISTSLSISGCAQLSEKPANPNEISVEFQHIAKRADVKKSIVALSNVPNAPPIARTYRPITNKAYKIETQTIDLGSPLVAVKVEVNSEADFKTVRVLRLIENEFRPRGYEWQDCTVSVETVLAFEGPDPSSWNSLDAYREVYAAKFPDYANRRIRCELNERMKPREHLVVVRQIEPVPTKVFTQLKFSFEADGKSVREEGDVTYELTFHNSGPADIGDLSFRSTFDPDTRLDSMKPASGNCVRSEWGTLDGSVVCHVGRLSVGGSTKIQLKGSFRSVPGGDDTGKGNSSWQIVAVIRERENDPAWAVNRFFVWPLHE
jgi:hypothetical protein